MSTQPHVLLMVTTDTKSKEGQFVRDRLESLGMRVSHLDASIRLFSGDSTAEITPENIAEAAGETIDGIRSLNHEGKAQAKMIEGAVGCVLALHERDPLSGVISIGGSMGTTLASVVMKALPFGLPKVMVSTMASGMTRPFVGTKDIAMFNSVADISGLNSITRSVFSNAAHALAGAAQHYQPTNPDDKPLVLMSTLGTTEACCRAVREKLEQHGFEVVIFHSSGMGGSALDEIAADQNVAAVVDLSVSELNDLLNDGLCSAGPDRCKPAMRKGIPTVFAPGNADFIIAGPIEEAMEKFPNKRYHIHNAALTAVRTERDELIRLADHLASIMGEGSGPVAINVPLQGFSAHDSPTGHIQDTSLPPVFAERIREMSPERAVVNVVDAHINDTEFVDSVVNQVLAFTRT